MEDKKREIVNKINDIKRYCLLKKITGNLGSIIEKTSIIYCYIDQKMVDKLRDKDSGYRLMLDGVTKDCEDECKKLGITKPICYFFKNITFKDSVQISSINAKVVFLNCTFNNNVGLLWADEVKFEDNKFEDNYPKYEYGSCFLTVTDTRKVTFVNENFSNSSNNGIKNKVNFGMSIHADEIGIYNSKIIADYTTDLTLNADKVKIYNSKIFGQNIKIKTKNIELNESSLRAKEYLKIEGNRSYDMLYNLLNRTEESGIQRILK